LKEELKTSSQAGTSKQEICCALIGVLKTIQLHDSADRLSLLVAKNRIILCMRAPTIAK